MKKELEGIYTAGDRYRRFKRQHRHDETSSVQRESASATKKQLKFDNQVVREPADYSVSYSPSCSASNQATQLLQVNHISSLQHSHDGSLQLVYNAFGFPSLPLLSGISTGQILTRRLFTSNPITKPLCEKHSTNNVKLTVDYPSNTVNKTLTTEFEAIGKAIVHGPPSRVAKAVLKCKAIRSQVIEQVLGVVSNEVNDLCSRKNPSLLRKNGKNDLINYDMLKLCEEWQTRAPVFYAFLLTCSTSKRHKHQSTWYQNIILSGSILLKRRNNHMSATASVIGLLMKTKSIEI